MNSLSDIINNSTIYFVVVAILYVLVISFVIFLIVRNKKKKLAKVKVEQTQKKDLEAVDLESVLDKMQEDVNKVNVDEVKSFEEEQEEKAIISYQELLQAVKKNVDNVTKVEIKEDQKDVLEEKKEEVSVMPEEQDESIVTSPKKQSSKFQNSEFISPIYGRVDNDINYPKIPVFRDQENEVKSEEDLGKTIVFDAIKSDNSDEFLKALKEFRNNLE